MPRAINQSGLAVGLNLVTTMLVTAPGGYRRGGCWRLRLPLLCIVAGLGTWLIVLTWPL